jgi:hypothetical protein
MTAAYSVYFYSFRCQVYAVYSQVFTVRFLSITDTRMEAIQDSESIRNGKNSKIKVMYPGPYSLLEERDLKTRFRSHGQ